MSEQNDQPVVEPKPTGPNERKIESIRDYMKDGPKTHLMKVPLSHLNSPQNPLTPLHRPEQKPKVIVLKKIYHRKEDGTIQQAHESKFSRHLNSNDDSFQRTITIGEQWVKLDTAWISTIGYLSFRNNGWKPFQVIPTPEQMQEAYSRVIEVGYAFEKIVTVERLRKYDSRNPRTAFDPSNETQLLPEKETVIEPFWLIAPGESLDGKPFSGRDIYLRCQHGQTYITIFVVPN